MKQRTLGGPAISKHHHDLLGPGPRAARRGEHVLTRVLERLARARLAAQALGAGHGLYRLVQRNSFKILSIPSLGLNVNDLG